jgi:MFS family permease
MGIIIFGPLLSDFLTFIVFLFSDTLPGKYWLLAIAPVMEGIMGGEPARYDIVFYDWIAIQPLHPSWLRKYRTCVISRNYLICRSLTLAKCHARLTYLTSSARNFSLLIGIFYAGGAIGPVLGGSLNQQIGSVIAAFYAATVIHLLYALLAWFAMPESITKAAMIHARKRYADELASAVDTDTGPFRRQATVLVKSFWDSFPLHVLAPKPTPNLRRKDWNTTWLAISAGLINAIMVRPAR